MVAVTTKRSVVLGAALSTALLVALKPDALVAAWRGIAELIDVSGEPVGASPMVMSQHEIEELSGMKPDAQALRLIDRAINHYDGATEQIAARVDGWRGNLGMSRSLHEHLVTAMSSNDLRVRAAGIEIYLAAYGAAKTPETVDRVMKRIDSDPVNRAEDLWTLGLLGNRGVEPQRVLDFLVRYLDDPALDERKWAVEGVAMLGTDASIEPLLHAFHDDPSGMIRERAACTLAQSGMLTLGQRWKAIPELIAFTDDPKLDGQTQRWAFQALQDISGQRLDNDPTAWRAWWDRSPKPPTARQPGVAIAQSPK